ncbi:DUF2846 domain-containing protein [Vibrio sp. MEBiC08052]|uniref:DUF2846 domain-containing protein n=1 Tax=Vibrio sp. MEBiC08052 TaxID=1761910 RepID=UPI0007405C3A|nr:DUF2846 domain-containing protein [Vibrio sp. MEBiC08052]KUI99307.1 hypothetical protein VRK_13910 [Vibrio sp. MEBiC08052]
MYKKLVAIACASILFAGCASVPLEDDATTNQAKAFNPPSKGHAGLYIYRSGALGGALKKDVWVDSECVGETAPDVFFYKEVAGNQAHQISTESEFSPNVLSVTTESGENYFIKQYIKLGVFVGGAGLEEVNAEEAKKTIQKLKMAKPGHCSK